MGYREADIKQQIEIGRVINGFLAPQDFNRVVLPASRKLRKMAQEKGRGHLDKLFLSLRTYKKDKPDPIIYELSRYKVTPHDVFELYRLQQEIQKAIDWLTGNQPLLRSEIVISAIFWLPLLILTVRTKGSQDFIETVMAGGGLWLLFWVLLIGVGDVHGGNIGKVVFWGFLLTLYGISLWWVFEKKMYRVSRLKAKLYCSYCACLSPAVFIILKIVFTGRIGYFYAWLFVGIVLTNLLLPHIIKKRRMIEVLPG